VFKGDDCLHTLHLILSIWSSLLGKRDSIALQDDYHRKIKSDTCEAGLMQSVKTINRGGMMQCRSDRDHKIKGPDCPNIQLPIPRELLSFITHSEFILTTTTHFNREIYYPFWSSVESIYTLRVSFALNMIELLNLIYLYFHGVMQNAEKLFIKNPFQWVIITFYTRCLK